MSEAIESLQVIRANHDLYSGGSLLQEDHRADWWRCVVGPMDKHAFRINDPSMVTVILRMPASERALLVATNDI